MMHKNLWSVTVYKIGFGKVKIYAESREEAKMIASRYEAHDDVKFAGKFNGEKASELLNRL